MRLFGFIVFAHPFAIEHLRVSVGASHSLTYGLAMSDGHRYLEKNIGTHLSPESIHTVREKHTYYASGGSFLYYFA